MSKRERAQVQIGATSSVGEYCVLGAFREARIRDEINEPIPPVVIGENCVVLNHVVIHEGTRIGNSCFVEDKVRIGYNCRIDSGTRLVYGAYVCDRVEIGRDARVAGFICDGTTIGNRSTVMGQLVHEYTQPHQDWWDVDEEPPAIHHDVVIGYGAHVIGGVSVGPHSYVAAGAVVTKDVPSHHIVTGVNVQTPSQNWQGARLQPLITHLERPCPEC